MNVYVHYTYFKMIYVKRKEKYISKSVKRKVLTCIHMNMILKMVGLVEKKQT